MLFWQLCVPQIRKRNWCQEEHTCTQTVLSTVALNLKPSPSFARHHTLTSLAHCRAGGSMVTEVPKINFCNFRFHTDPFLQWLPGAKVHMCMRLKRFGVKPKIQLVVNSHLLFPTFHVFLLQKIQHPANLLICMRSSRTALSPQSQRLDSSPKCDCDVPKTLQSVCPFKILAGNLHWDDNQLSDWSEELNHRGWL